uniref:Uncharacterized protein n=1 Tax=Brassica oleracea TaxID=3712 RepID=A0A3P6ECX7_BRAOL|nr:unnamed protein product [Brassica oleracea]
MREGFGTCLKEIKYLSERVEAVEKKTLIGYYCILHSESVNGTRRGRKSLAEDRGPMCPQLCPQMLVPRKIKLQNRALFYWTKINPLFQICRRRMLDI